MAGVAQFIQARTEQSADSDSKILIQEQNCMNGSVSFVLPYVVEISHCNQASSYPTLRNTRYCCSRQVSMTHLLLKAKVSFSL